jgi:phosphatidylglycerophosphatase A
MKIKNKTDLIIDLAASGFRVGYISIASGTFGTLLAIPFVVLARIYMPEFLYFLLTVLIIIFSIFVAGRAEKIYDEKDSSKIIIDEIAGYFVTCLFLPLLRWDFFVVAFFAFRFFDIVKLWPASYFDRRQGGASVVLDDVFAGVYALVCLQIYFFLSTLFLISLSA